MKICQSHPNFCLSSTPNPHPRRIPATCHCNRIHPGHMGLLTNLAKNTQATLSAPAMCLLGVTISVPRTAMCVVQKHSCRFEGLYQESVMGLFFCSGTLEDLIWFFMVVVNMWWDLSRWRFQTFLGEWSRTEDSVTGDTQLSKLTSDLNHGGNKNMKMFGMIFLEVPKSPGLSLKLCSLVFNPLR